MSFGITASAGDPLRRGLVRWYRMLGNPNDSSGNAFNGTTVGSPTLTSDKFSNANSAYSLTASPLTYISLPSGFVTGTNAFSLSTWVRAASAASNRIYAQGSSTSLQPLVLLEGANANVRFTLRTLSGSLSTQTTGTATAFDNTWHHVAVSCPATGNCTIFVDGASDTTFNPTRATISSLDTCSIGTFFRTGAASGGFTGSLFDFRVYNRAITADEVGTLFRATQRI